jgi:hypothetical protein
MSWRPVSESTRLELTLIWIGAAASVSGFVWIVFFDHRSLYPQVLSAVFMMCNSTAMLLQARRTDEQLSRPVDQESAVVYGYDQSSNGSLISSPSRKALSSAGSWPG